MTPTPPPEQRSWRRRARGLYDRLPTKWLITGITAVLLGLSAAVGGLNEVAATPIPELEVGDPFEALSLTITPEQASLIDAFPEQGVIPDDGNRLLVVVATVTNTSAAPVKVQIGGDADSLLPVDVEFADSFDGPSTIIVFDDGTQVSTVQPDVPVKLAYVWEIPAGAIADGDELRIDLLDRDNEGEADLYYGDRFSDYRVAGFVTFAVDDLGAGVGG